MRLFVDQRTQKMIYTTTPKQSPTPHTHTCSISEAVEAGGQTQIGLRLRQEITHRIFAGKALSNWL